MENPFPSEHAEKPSDPPMLEKIYLTKKLILL
jgi:hypothetical protein